DPPYDLPEAELGRVLESASSWLDPRGVVVVERSKRSAVPLWPASMEDSWKRDYGETALHFAMRGEQ
ncbi:MAG: RsmD family RNA methyltransferase, partial [Propionibacteriaceae bacterium]|nr:RsmD family RNA methyltransferase [Propionibacteriaceae bacterium]